MGNDIILFEDKLLLQGPSLMEILADAAGVDISLSENKGAFLVALSNVFTEINEEERILNLCPHALDFEFLVDFRSKTVRPVIGNFDNYSPPETANLNLKLE